MAAAVQPSKLATKIFLPTGAEQTYKVPAGVRTVRITAVGGTGGGNLSRPGLFFSQRPGRGAVVTAPVGVSPRSTLYVEESFPTWYESGRVGVFPTRYESER